MCSLNGPERATLAGPHLGIFACDHKKESRGENWRRVERRSDSREARIGGGESRGEVMVERLELEESREEERWLMG